METPFEIFLSAPPGLEPLLQQEVAEAGFDAPELAPGGVVTRGGWPEVWRANLCLRGAGRVLVRFAEFRAFHLAQLDKRARKLDWGAVLPKGAACRVDVTCRNSKIYHDRAARARIAGAIEAFGGTVSPEGALRVMARIEDDLVTLSLDTSGELLHRRGWKEAVGKAPLRETLAALFLRASGYDGSEPVVDPMCGSGTFVIEAAQWAAGMAPGRARDFAFEDLPSFRAGEFATLKAETDVPGREAGLREAGLLFHGSDRDDGAIRGATANAERAGVADLCRFRRAAISDLERPEGTPGLVMVNPPYGARIGDRKLLFGLYGSLGAVLKERFAGWRLGMVTSDGGLAKATGLDLRAGPPVAFGGLTVKLYQAEL
ncbi:THUMP domain-containing class I SAM-dependent RNA methyltransferase [Sagittula salina]|uniref:Class I SAM-dependent RNA methyltransferase n=1 Tax=Sagittula salina TaxID=2820268 RepID=A0A940S286_9RHOB|nr:class I SAM-dependent RNA methyltransferase [Sagittula salina]MBP0483846.1 class I SAM-dependent RNA methyltransferase [Sagittula salina]